MSPELPSELVGKLQKIETWMAAFFSLKDFRVVEETKTICSWNSWREIKNMKPYDTDFKYKTVQGRLKWIMFFLWEGISSREIGVCSKMCKKIKSSWLVWLSYKGMLNIHVPEAWGIFPFNNRRNTVSLKKKWHIAIVRIGGVWFNVFMYMLHNDQIRKINMSITSWEVFECSLHKEIIFLDFGLLWRWLVLQ